MWPDRYYGLGWSYGGGTFRGKGRPRAADGRWWDVRAQYDTDGERREEHLHGGKLSSRGRDKRKARRKMAAASRRKNRG